MAERYVTQASAGGTGTAIDPWNWATMVAKINDSTVDNGDRINVQADATYTGIADYAITRSADDASWITIQGYTTDIGDGGRPTIQRAGAEVGTWADHITGNFYLLKDLIFDGNSEGNNTGFTFSQNTHSHYERITVKNGADQYQIRGGHGQFFNCDCDNAGGYGIYLGYWYNCIIQDSGSHNAQSPVVMVNCIIKGTGGHGCFIVQDTVNCIFDGSEAGSNPLFQRGHYRATHCIFVNAPAGRYGFVGDYGRESIVSCGFYNNAGGTYTALTRTFGTQVTTDPQFNNAGALDYTRTGSNYDSKGYNDIGMVGVDYNMDIGPFQKAAGGAAATTAVGVIGG